MEFRFLNFVLFILLSFSVSSQNLVRNPSFEEYDVCPEKQEFRIRNCFNGYVRDWQNYGPIKGRYTHLDCNPMLTYLDNVPLDSILPYDNEAIVILNANYKTTSPVNGFETRAYYSSRLLAPLQKDSTYKVSYYIHSNKHYAIADHYGCVFARDTSDLQFTTIGDTLSMILKDDFIGFRDTFYGPDKLYHKIEGCYLAQGGEEFIVFGPFLPPDKVHWHSGHKGYLQNTSFIILLDKVEVIKTSRTREADQNVQGCDGETISLPLPTHQNTTIKDTLGHIVSTATIDWPNDQIFYYEDACFGRLGEIMVSPKICMNPIDTTLTICNEELLTLTSLFPQDYTIQNDQGEQITTFRSAEIGIFRLKTIHKKYGEYGQVTIEVVKCENCDLHVPNILILDSARGNDKWQPRTACTFDMYEANIYDRWGNLMFHSVDPSRAWDGRYNGTHCVPGVYVYSIKYLFRHPIIPQEVKYKNGDITIIR